MLPTNYAMRVIWYTFTFRVYKKNSYNYQIILWKKNLKFIRDRIYDFKLKKSDYYCEDWFKSGRILENPKGKLIVEGKTSSSSLFT